MALKIADNRKISNVSFDELESGDFFILNNKLHTMTDVDGSATCLEDGIH